MEDNLFRRRLVDKRILYVGVGFRINLETIGNINIYNEDEMQRLGLRRPFINKQIEVFKKTKSEKKALKKAKRLVKEKLLSRGLNSKKVMNANPTKLLQYFDNYSLNANKGLSRNISSTDPEKFCTLHGYLQKQKEKRNS